MFTIFLDRWKREKNVIIFGIDNSFFLHIDGRNNNTLVLGEGQTQGLDNATITAEDKYSINFKQSEKRFVLILHRNGSDSFLFVNGVKMYQFKAKDSEIKPYPLCLHNISKEFTIDNVTKTSLKENVQIFLLIIIY